MKKSLIWMQEMYQIRIAKGGTILYTARCCGSSAQKKGQKLGG